jgi:hypothetical protein
MSQSQIWMPNNSHAKAQRRRGLVVLFLLCASAPLREIASFLVADSARACAVEPAAKEVEARAAVEKSLPLLQEGARTFRERSEGRCISCHHQGLILQTVALARERGFAVDENLARAEVERVHGFYARRQARYRAALDDPAAAGQADPFGNFTVHAGYWLWGLAAEKVSPDESLLATARLLAARQRDDGRWTFTDVARAPMQASDIATTALAQLALQHYGGADEEEANQRRLAAAKAWMLKSTPRTTDDKAFRLLGLYWLHAAVDDRQQAAAELLTDQRADGGWAQQANMPTDAYATGLAWVALAEAGELSVGSRSYENGAAYLLARQHSDGSWYVKTRAIPTNPYFESGFPHGKSQFISYAATCWATMALALEMPAPGNR